MLNVFEKKAADGEARLPNVIIMRVPHSGQKDFDDGGGAGGGQAADSAQIIGGYASHGWAASREKQGQGGNETCFLFNLTQNLRFNAITGKEGYMTTENAENTTSNRQIKFGGDALTISPDFRTVTSRILGPQADPGACFAFGEELM